MKSKRYIQLLPAVLIAVAVLAACHTAQPEVTTQPTTQPPTETTALPMETGFLAAPSESVLYQLHDGTEGGRLTRGAQVEYVVNPDGSKQIFLNGQPITPEAGAYPVSQLSDTVPACTMYVRTAVNLRDQQGRLLPAFGEKGAAVEITGCDYPLEDGRVHMYRVRLGEETGYIMPAYLAATQEEALSNYDGGSYAIHADREDHYGGGYGANLDYFPREKGPIAGNEMPGEVRALYIAGWCIENVDAYMEIAASSGINAFVVDITDSGAVAYAADVMHTYAPTAAAGAANTVEAYQAAIRKLKDGGYYVIGRITTFNDSGFVQDHPEYAIVDTEGAPLKLSGEYWPTPYSREAWQYKVDLAVEAVEMMGFHEIQFDYVRFPDNTGRYERAGTVDFRNTYGETKAQAIQRFLMYATDILHEHGAYVSADVYGESAYTYVTGYGQYWPAISNVVDAISGMPYPDHFSASGDWLPWEHPYETLNTWGEHVMRRQSETATPAVVRTWIQAYDAIRPPYNGYGAEEVAAQIRGLRDAGCTGGYMTWNFTSSVDKYTQLIPAFAPPGA